MAYALDHGQLKKMVDYSVDEMEEAREQSRRARQYYDSEQLTAAEVAVLRKRKQPQLVINRIKRKIDAMVGLEQRGRVDPRALPRNPQDEQGADIATKALVFADDVTRFDQKRSQFCYNLAIEGYGGVEINVRQAASGIDPEIIRLRWEEIFFDPHSRELDFSDASYVGIEKWMSLDKAKAFARRFNQEMPEDELDALLQASLTNTSASMDDRPSHTARRAWGDPKTQRVKFAYVYYECDGIWRLALFTGGGVIYDEPSPFLDYTDDPSGKPACGMVLQACYINQENQRYGIVTDMIPMQDEINKRRSKLLHMLNSRQTMGQAGSTAMPVEDIKRELALPDGHVEYIQDPNSTVPSFAIVPNGDQVQGQFELLQESKGEIDMLGPNASLLGQLEGQHSGRAIIAQQQAGMAELAPFYDAMNDWTVRVYRQMWNRIRQFWTEPRWVRVTDEDSGAQFVGINQPMPGVINMDGSPVVQNRVGQLDVDIIIDAQPEYASLQYEQFQTLAELAKTGMVQIPPDVIIEASSLRNKQKLLEKLNDPQAQQQQMMAMQAQMAQLAEAVNKLAAEAENKRADTALKIAQTEQIRQETALEPVRLASEARAAADKGDMDRARFGEDVRRGRVAEGREDARMNEDFRAARASEELARMRPAAGA